MLEMRLSFSTCKRILGQVHRRKSGLKMGSRVIVQPYCTDKLPRTNALDVYDQGRSLLVNQSLLRISKRRFA